MDECRSDFIGLKSGAALMALQEKERRIIKPTLAIEVVQNGFVVTKKEPYSDHLIYVFPTIELALKFIKEQLKDKPCKKK